MDLVRIGIGVFLPILLREVLVFPHFLLRRLRLGGHGGGGGPVRVLLLVVLELNADLVLLAGQIFDKLLWRFACNRGGLNIQGPKKDDMQEPRSCNLVAPFLF